MSRFSLMPAVGDGLTQATIRRAKYVDADALRAGWTLAPYMALDYGLEPVFLVATDLSTSDQALLAAQPDVTIVPANLDATVTAGALPVVQAALEALNLPAQWVTTAHTYRQVLGVVVRISLLAQRFHGLGFGRIFTSGVTLNTTISALSAQARTRLATAAQGLGLDTSGVTNGVTLRQALKLLGDQLTSTYTFGGEVF
jgi:hypothetical protein